MKRVSRIAILSLAFVAITAMAWVMSARESGATASKKPQSMHRFWPAPMPSYPLAREMPMSEDMYMGQARMKMAWFQTPDEPIKVANFYEGVWESAGYYVTREVHPYGGKVAAMDLKTNLLRQVMMTRDGAETTVYVSLIMGSPTQLLGSPTAELQLPVVPGAEGITQMGSRDPMANTSVIVYVNRETIQDNVGFYKTEMASRGYRLSADRSKIREISEKMGMDVQLLIFEREGEEVTVSISQVEDSRMTRVHMTRVRGKGR